MKTHVAKLKPEGERGIIFWSAAETIGYSTLDPEGKMSLTNTWGVSPKELRKFATHLLLLCDAHEKAPMAGHEELPGWTRDCTNNDDSSQAPI
jgi:hypothetical protein